MGCGASSEHAASTPQTYAAATSTASSSLSPCSSLPLRELPLTHAELIVQARIRALKAEEELAELEERAQARREKAERAKVQAAQSQTKDAVVPEPAAAAISVAVPAIAVATTTVAGDPPAYATTTPVHTALPDAPQKKKTQVTAPEKPAEASDEALSAAQRASRKAAQADKLAAEADGKADEAKIAAKNANAGVQQVAAAQSEDHAQLEMVKSDLAKVRLPSRISNLPRLCAHFLPRPAVFDAIKQLFASTTVDCPVVCMHGIAGSGKSELAKQYTLAAFESDTSRASVVWLFNAESIESTFISYKLLLRALGLEWKVEPEEEGKQDLTLARLHADIQNRIRGQDVILLYDNCVSYHLIKPYIPTTTAGVKAKILLTSLHMNCMEEDSAAGRFKLSLNGGLSEEEALSLLSSTSGIATSPDHHSADDLALIKALDRLPLAISTAGLTIFQRRAPPKKRIGVGAAAAVAELTGSSFGTKEYLLELRSHCVVEDSFSSSSAARSQKDSNRGQAAALQFAIAHVPPPFRTVLDCCVLLSSQDLPYELMREIYCNALNKEAAAATAGGKAVAPLTGADADDAFQAVLASADTFSLLYVDPKSNRLSMHRSTQLQLAILAENAHSSVAGSSSASTSSSSPPIITRLGSVVPRNAAAGGSSSFAPPSHSLLLADPTPLHRWTCARLGEVLAAMESAFPAGLWETERLIACTPILPTITRLLLDARHLPLLHPSLSSVHSLLLSQSIKLLRSLHCAMDWSGVIECGNLAEPLCSPNSENHFLVKFWRAWGYAGRGEGRQEMMAIYAELAKAHPHDWAMLRFEIGSVDRSKGTALAVDAQGELQQLLSLHAESLTYHQQKPNILSAMLEQSISLQHYWVLKHAAEGVKWMERATSTIDQIHSAADASGGAHVYAGFLARSYLHWSSFTQTPLNQRLSLVRQSLAIRTRIYGPHHARTLECSGRLIRWQLVSGNAALKAAGQKELDELTAGMDGANLPDHEHVAEFWQDRVADAIVANATDKAVAYAQRATEVSQRMYSPAHYAQLNCLHLLSQTRFLLGGRKDITVIRSYRREVLSLLPLLEGSVGPALKALHTLAWDMVRVPDEVAIDQPIAAAAAGSPSSAVSCSNAEFEYALRHRRITYAQEKRGALHPLVVTAQLEMAAWLKSKGREQEAVEMFEAALGMVEQTMNKSSSASSPSSSSTVSLHAEGMKALAGIHQCYARMSVTAEQQAALDQRKFEFERKAESAKNGAESNKQPAGAATSEATSKPPSTACVIC